MEAKPTKVEVGQRYLNGVVTAVFADFSCGGRHAGDVESHVHYELSAWDYLEDVGTKENPYIGGPPPQGEPAPMRTCGACKAAFPAAMLWRDHKCGPLTPLKPPAPVHGRMIGETRSLDGTPLTALQAIQARKKPDPWVESCDPLHWIPDAP